MTAHEPYALKNLTHPQFLDLALCYDPIKVY